MRFCPKIKRFRDDHYFNPRTPLQSAIGHQGPQRPASPISIHALHYRVRSHDRYFLDNVTNYFNPRTPLQSAILLSHMLPRSRVVISIHALHYRVRSIALITFISGHLIFQSTHSITECDVSPAQYVRLPRQISIHALHYRVRLDHHDRHDK